nr:RNA-directed DNA polymerase, eukaryota [Tanacetum cinerariifolium]
SSAATRIFEGVTIKVFDVERLISNLCTIWVRPFKLHANVARFQREPMNKQKDKVNANGTSKVSSASRKNGDGLKRTVNSYAYAVTGYDGYKEPIDNIPTMVLDETCLNNEEYSLSLLGKVKEFASLTILKVVLAKEVFLSIEIKYMGGFWVMIVFQDDETKKRFQSNVAVGSWFSQIIQAHNEFNLDERVMWVEIEGVPYKWWSKNTFKRIASKWGTMLNGDELEEGGFHSNRLCICTKMKTVLMKSFRMVYCGKVCWVPAIEVPGWVPNFEEDSDVETNDGSHEDEVQDINSGDHNNFEGDSDIDEDPETCFEDESNKQCMDENFIRQSEPLLDESCKYPPGFTPNDVVDTLVNADDDVLEDNRTRNEKEDGGSMGKENQGRSAWGIDTNVSTCSGHFKKSGVPRTGGSIIQLIDDLVTVGQTMGYDMTGLAQKAKKDWVKELCVSNKVNFVSLQETKMTSMDLWCIKSCWGNFDFDYVYSEAVGNSGGILCVWDPNMFKKSNATVLDFFTIVRGTWLPSGKRLLVISVYAPQELRDKKMLWDYLVTVICNWDGEVVTMGDFNEVRDCSERLGYVFNKKGAEVFNNFIVTAGLVEVTLGGCSFTWCRKSATKMSKLDRFLIFDNLMRTCPTISSISLDRFLKEKIRKWNCVYKESKNYGMRNLKVELNSLESVIDNGNGTDLVINCRMEVIRLMQEMEKADNLVVAQKAKIKWEIEGDENSKYYHGVLNKKTSRLTIRDVLADVKWFFIHRSIPKGGNSTFITLIPKISNANMVKDFRAISLIGSIYKIVAKILANRLVTVLGGLVNEIQSAFVADRQILDGPWEFVDDILKKFGFGEKWCMWIRSCLKSSRGSVIVNGSPTQEF